MTPPPENSPTLERTAEFWNKRHAIADSAANDNFLDHPMIQAYVSLRAFGNLTGHLDAVIVEIRTRTKPGARILSLGCGPALKEMAMAAALPDRQFVAQDIAQETLDRARIEAERRGIANLTLELGDFNRLDLPPKEFEIITMLGALHHVEALEDFWQQSRRTLLPGGVVLAQEYVGPNRMQWTDRQIALANAALRDIVPLEHCVHHTIVERTPVSVMQSLDPSEAVRSAEILPTCKSGGFRLQGYASAGCALLQPVLMYQVHTFAPRNWAHNRILASLFAEEERHMQSGELGDDFAMFVAVPV